MSPPLRAILVMCLACCGCPGTKSTPAETEPTTASPSASPSAPPAPSSSSNPTATLDAALTDANADAASSPATLASAGAPHPIVLVVPSGSRPSFKTFFVDCVKHSQWNVPPEWQTASAGTTDTAWDNDRAAVIVRSKTGDRSGKELEATVRRIAGPSIALVFDAPTVAKTGEKPGEHTMTTTRGRGTDTSGATVLSFEATVDDDRGLNVGAPHDFDILWVKVTTGLLRDDTMAQIQKVVDVPLPTDACKCTYDCVSRH